MACRARRLRLHLARARHRRSLLRRDYYSKARVGAACATLASPNRSIWDDVLDRQTKPQRFLVEGNAQIRAKILCHGLATTRGIRALSAGANGRTTEPNYARALQGVDDQSDFRPSRDISTPAASTILSLVLARACSAIRRVVSQRCHELAVETASPCPKAPAASLAILTEMSEHGVIIVR